MIENLLIAIILISVVLAGLLVFIWFQLNNTNSRLIRIIQNRIRLNNIDYDLDRVCSVIVETEEE